MKFTAHNILLKDGTRTFSNTQLLISESAVWRSIEDTVNLFFPCTKEERSKLRVVDLGCLEGGYAVEFARMGFNTLGIEAREDNLEKCGFVKANLDLPNLKFVKDDVRNLANYGNFDIVFCYGLLYHLDDPINFLGKLSSCSNRLFLLNTHYAREKDLRYDLGVLNNYIIAPLQEKVKRLDFSKNYKLSKLTLNEGYRGRWFKEWNENLAKNRIEKALWASYNNSKSFWLTKRDLTKAIHSVGFKSVFEQFNYTGDIMKDNYEQYYDRTMFVAVKH